VAVALSGFICLIFLGDLIEMLRRFGDKEGVSFPTIVSMTLLKMINVYCLFFIVVVDVPRCRSISLL
jgi:lipopolysaccharide export LptBFGC system permease protein LptF